MKRVSSAKKVRERNYITRRAPRFLIAAAPIGKIHTPWLSPNPPTQRSPQPANRLPGPPPPPPCLAPDHTTPAPRQGRVWLDGAKARRELGMPETPLADSVARSVAWFRDNQRV